MAKAADRVPLLFVSTQLRPIAEAQKMRNVILKDFLHEVEFVTTTSQQAATLINQQMMGSTHAADVVGALHGELQPLAQLNALLPLDALVQKQSTRSVPASLLALGKVGTAHQQATLWSQTKKPCHTCRRKRNSIGSATVSSPLGPVRSSKEPASACSASPRDHKG